MSRPKPVDDAVAAYVALVAAEAAVVRMTNILNKRVENLTPEQAEEYTKRAKAVDERQAAAEQRKEQAVSNVKSSA